MEELLIVFSSWLLHYGAPVLFFLLLLGIVGMPIPDETLLILSGWLMAKGKLHFVPTILAAIIGSICGITLSYILGKYAGNWLIERYGDRLRLSSSKVQRIQDWYGHIGKWLLFIGYFIPVVRHLSGFVAGGAKLSFRQFMLYAYTGALIWSTTFLAVGYFLIIEIKKIPKI